MIISNKHYKVMNNPGNTKGGSITVPLTSCLTGLDESVYQIKTKIVSCHTADSKPVKQEVNGTVILPPLVFPEIPIKRFYCTRREKVYLALSMTMLRERMQSAWRPTCWPPVPYFQ